MQGKRRDRTRQIGLIVDDIIRGLRCQSPAAVSIDRVDGVITDAKCESGVHADTGGLAASDPGDESLACAVMGMMTAVSACFLPMC